MAAWSMVSGLAANFVGFMLIGRFPWPVSLGLIALGTSGLVGAMLLVALADRKHRPQALACPAPN